MTGNLDRTAQYIIRLTNPVFLSPLLIAAIMFAGFQSMVLLAEEIAILLLLLIVVPLGYVLLRMRATGTKGDPTTYLKRRPYDILALELVSGLPCWLLLTYIKAPVFATDSLVALIAAAFITAIINVFYHTSFHLAAFTVLICLVAGNWGPLFLLLLLLIPVIAWAKHRLHEHTPMQLLTGTVLGAAIVLLITTFI